MKSLTIMFLIILLISCSISKSLKKENKMKNLSHNALSKDLTDPGQCKEGEKEVCLKIFPPKCQCFAPSS